MPYFSVRALQPESGYSRRVVFVLLPHSTNIRCGETHAIDHRLVDRIRPPPRVGMRGVLIDRGERSLLVRGILYPDLTCVAFAVDVQGAANMLFITRSLLAGRGRPIRFQRVGQQRRAKAAWAARIGTRLEIDRLLFPPLPAAPGGGHVDDASTRAASRRSE